MNVHSGWLRFPVPLHHTEKFPAVTLIKRSVVCDKIQGVDPPLCHIRAHIAQQGARHPPAPPVLFRIHGADVGGQVLPVVKVIFDDPKAPDDPSLFHRHIPLGDGAFSRQAVLHTLHVGRQGNAPLLVEPPRGPLLERGPVNETDDLIFHARFPPMLHRPAAAPLRSTPGQSSPWMVRGCRRRRPPEAVPHSPPAA